MKKIHFTLLSLVAYEVMLIAIFARIHNTFTDGAWFLSSANFSILLWVILDLKEVSKKVSIPTCLTVLFLLCLVPFFSITINL